MLPETEKKITELTALAEGFRQFPYLCIAGKLTVGYGRNLEDRGITKEEAEFLLKNDIKLAEDAVRRKIIDYDFLDEVRKSVLVEMAFNLGIDGLLKFKKVFLALSEKSYPVAAKEMLDSLWAKQVGRRAVRLSQMMETGEWPDGIGRVRENSC